MFRPVVFAGDKKFHQENFYHADPSIFDIFTFPLLHGDPAIALKQPFSVVLTQEMAAKYFNSDNPIGQQISILNIAEFKVTGVAQNLPVDSHFRFDFLTSYETLRATGARNLHRCDNFVTSTYALLPERHAPSKLERSLRALVKSHTSEANSEAGSFFLTPPPDLHLHFKVPGEIGTGGDVKYIYIFSCLAGLVLCIACINFMNLSTARSLQRAKEVGVRKVIGCVRLQLVRQFLGEAILMA
jgi:putative ABC transport system permease protein